MGSQPTCLESWHGSPRTLKSLLNWLFESRLTAELRELGEKRIGLAEQLERLTESAERGGAT
jgi:hypothetical protein